MEGNGTVRDEEKARVVTISVPHGKPYAGKLHVRFDEGADVPDEGRSALLYFGGLVMVDSSEGLRKPVSRRTVFDCDNG